MLIYGFINNTEAMAATFDTGSLIIPMDTDYQDNGMFKAYGLIYQLLLNNITIHWAIREDKLMGESDFTTSAVDYQTNAEINAHEYRGGPFIISANRSSEALPIIDDWQIEHNVTLHQVTESFEAPVSTHLVAAPTIAVFADGKEDVAFGYLNAAGIPDSLGQPWPDDRDRSLQYPGFPDILDFDEVAGADYDNNHDGALFDQNRNPIYCQIMTMHWKVWDEDHEDAARNDGAVKEMRAFLEHPVHLMAECQAVNAIENSQYGHFLTPNGFLIGERPRDVEFFNSDTPFGQMDGEFETIGGSEPAFSLPEGDAYFDSGVVMITEAGTPIGTNDIWMTGYKDGACRIKPEPDEECTEPPGKISYLGGHKYKTDLPISRKPDSQGTRLFLNSLFEAPCATLSGQPVVLLTKSATQVSTSGEVTFELTYQNRGPGVITDVTVSDILPEGVIFISSSSEEVQESDGRVFWEETSLGEWDGGTLSITVELQDFGSYENTASITYNVGMNQRVVTSNTTTSFYQQDSDEDGIPDVIEQEGCTNPELADTDEDGFSDSEDFCPCHHNPLQELAEDPLNCGECGNVCLFAQAIPECILANCEMTGCEPGFSNCDGITTNGCEYDNTLFDSDPSNCGGCLQQCSFPNADSECLNGACLVGICHEGYYDIDGVPENGCEATCNPLPDSETSCNGIDDDCDGQIDEDFNGIHCTLEGCAGQTVCVSGEEECWTPAEDTEGPENPGSCSDQIDNDCDGMVDQTDPDCHECEEDSLCEDGLYCTVDDICFHGRCIAGHERLCETEESCQVGSCNETRNSCEYTTVPNCQEDIFEEEEEEDTAQTEDTEPIPDDVGIDTENTDTAPDDLSADISEPELDETEHNITQAASECGCRTLTGPATTPPELLIFLISFFLLLCCSRLNDQKIT